MKLAFVTTFAVLTLAGAVVAQPGATVAPMASDFEGTTTGQVESLRAAQVHDQATQDMLRSAQEASSQLHLACAADRATLCADARSSFRGDRCLERHSKDVNPACRTALSQAAMAWSVPR